MIFLPWAVFFIAIIWMIFKGLRAKSEYLQACQEKRKQANDIARLSASATSRMKNQTDQQKELPDLGSIFGEARQSNQLWN